MPRTPVPVVAAVAVVAALFVGCGPAPCATLAPPTPAELTAAASGADVEREVGGYDCDLVDGRWQLERD